LALLIAVISPEPAGPPTGDNEYLGLAMAIDLVGLTLAELRRRVWH
jgi:hypothetical protein